MVNKIHHNRGFSLIEIMVVLLIIGSVVAVVAPLTIKQLQTSEARSEFLHFRSTLKGLTAKAFTRGVSFQVEMKNSTVTVSSLLGTEVFEFEQLSLPQQTFYINRNGFPSVDKFTVQLAKQDKVMNLEDMLGVKQESIYVKQ